MANTNTAGAVAYVGKKVFLRSFWAFWLAPSEVLINLFIFPKEKKKLEVGTSQWTVDQL